MGCFNSIGFASGLPMLQGDKIVLILFGKGIEDDRRHVVYSWDLYAPIALPIFGEYNDYGGIENIVRDANVLKLEEIFGKPIDEVIEDIDNIFVGRYKSDEIQGNNFGSKKYRELSYGMERLEIYEYLSNNKRISYTTSYIGEYWLEKFGFILRETLEKEERYKYIYTHPIVEQKGYYIASDHYSSHFVSKQNLTEEVKIPYDKIQYMFHPNEMDEILRMYFDIDTQLTERDKMDCIFDISTKLYIDLYKKRKQRIVELGKELTVLAGRDDISADKKKKLEQDIAFEIYSIENNFRYEDERIKGIGTFKKLFNQGCWALKDYLNGFWYEDIVENVSAFARFTCALDRLHIDFRPSNYGSQDIPFNDLFKWKEKVFQVAHAQMREHTAAFYELELEEYDIVLVKGFFIKKWDDNNITVFINEKLKSIPLHDLILAAKTGFYDIKSTNLEFSDTSNGLIEVNDKNIEIIESKLELQICLVK